MTISMLLMILALTAGPGTSQSIQSSSPPVQTNTTRPPIVGHCWINGVWYNPCTSDPPSSPPADPGGPELQQ